MLQVIKHKHTQGQCQQALEGGQRATSAYVPMERRGATAVALMPFGMLDSNQTNWPVLYIGWCCVLCCLT